MKKMKVKAKVKDKKTERAVACSVCRARRSTARPLPIGWKDVLGNPLCDDCFGRSYVARTVTIPVAGPVSAVVDREEVEATWDVLRESLKRSWGATTRLANWLSSHLFTADCVRMPDMEKLPRFEAPYLYPEAVKIAPELDTGTVSSLEAKIKRRYIKRRYKVVWLGDASNASYRYPTPIPVRSQSWSLVSDENGRLLVSVALGRKERWVLRLRGGHEFARQTEALRRIVKGEVLAGELSIERIHCERSDHRPVIQTKAPGGGNDKVSRVVVRVSGWFPVERDKAAVGALVVRTDAESFLTYSVLGEDPVYRLNADHVRRWEQVRVWVGAHRERLLRFSDDAKHERRTRAERKGRLEKLDALARKQRDRLDSFTHEVSREIANFAVRRRVTEVVYDDSERGFVESFPWTELEQKLRYKLVDHGITLTSSSASDSVVPTVGAPLAEKEQEARA